MLLLKMQVTLSVAFFVFLPACCYSQKKAQYSWTPGNIPRRLLPSLARGLDEFIAQQSPEQWDTVPSWLKDQSEFDEPVEKKSSDKETRTIKFTPQITTGSTSNWSVPLEAREWEIWGCAMFRYEGEDIKTQALVVVRYKARKWHFSQFLLVNKQGHKPVERKSNPFGSLVKYVIVAKTHRWGVTE
jgi:hypothetical protein